MGRNAANKIKQHPETTLQAVKAGTNVGHRLLVIGIPYSLFCEKTITFDPTKTNTFQTDEDRMLFYPPVPFDVADIERAGNTSQTRVSRSVDTNDKRPVSGHEPRCHAGQPDQPAQRDAPLRGEHRHLSGEG